MDFLLLNMFEKFLSLTATRVKLMDMVFQTVYCLLVTQKVIDLFLTDF